MPLSIETFRNDIGGSVLYKALTHPLVAEAAQALVAALKAAGPIAIYDPDGVMAAFDEFYPLAGVEIAGFYVQRVEHLENRFRGQAAKPATELAQSGCGAVLIASFNPRAAGHVEAYLPKGARRFDFETLKLPRDLQTDRGRYLSALNFATNFAFFRDSGGRHTRMVTANYWPRYGAKDITFWCRLFDASGKPLASWSEKFGATERGIVLDSADIRKRFDLPEFCGQLFVHVVGAAGHDIVKYALDIYGDDTDALSATHDANSWPADSYAGLPAPKPGEDIVLWVQNTHPVTIPAGEVAFGYMGKPPEARMKQPIAPYATAALNVSEHLPQARWPAQLEIQAGRYFVRPRYEVVDAKGRRHMAHANVQRNDLKPDPKIATLQNLMGKMHLLPASILPPKSFASIVLPTPMANTQNHVPAKALVYDAKGKLVGEHRFGNLKRSDSVAIDMSDYAAGISGFDYGHMELVYDFDAGTEADGWLHALFRYADRASGYEAETSFGAHIFNTLLTYNGEPQSYSGPPPGLSTRLFLRVAPQPYETLCHLIYPVSQEWRPHSTTTLTLRAEDGREVASKTIEIPASGSYLWRVSETFEKAALREAGTHPCVIVRDETCRLFGYHGVTGSKGSFSYDHMFGF